MLNLDDWLKIRNARSKYIPRTFDCRKTFVLDDCKEYSDITIGDVFLPNQHLSVNNWGVHEIAKWLVFESQNLDVDCSELHAETFFLLAGADLMKMTETDFCQVTADYGKHLYDSIQSLKKKYQPYSASQTLEGTENLCFAINSILVNSADYVKLKLSSSIAETTNAGNQEEKVPSNPAVTLNLPVKKGRGRPKNPNKKGKKKVATLGRVWEFLRELLKDPAFCPSVIKWDNHDEGTFCFVKSEYVAKLWGSRKGNVAMNYEKLSRAIRYYYKSKILLPVYGRRLVYKFGPKATGWRVNDPNFENGTQFHQ